MQATIQHDAVNPIIS